MGGPHNPRPLLSHTQALGRSAAVQKRMGEKGRSCGAEAEAGVLTRAGRDSLPKTHVSRRAPRRRHDTIPCAASRRIAPLSHTALNRLAVQKLPVYGREGMGE